MGSSRPPLLLILAANPTKETLDLQGELDGIRSELERIDLAHVLQLVHVPVTTPDTLQQVLLEHDPTVVQFSGHGQGTEPDGAPAGIMLECDSDDQARIVSGAVLGQLFAAAGKSVRLVLLNACHSDEQAEALLEHVDFVIGMSDAIGDAGAKTFSKAFHRALAYGKTIHDAFELAVNALDLDQHQRDAKRVRLRTRAGADASKTSIVPAPEPDDSAWDVYIAYAKADEDEAQALAAGLDERGLRAYCFEDLFGAVELLDKEDAVQDSKHGLVIVSTTSMDDPKLREQYAALLDKAVEKRRLLIPTIVGEGNVELPPFLKIRRPADLRGKTSDEREHLLDQIKRALTRRR